MAVRSKLVPNLLSLRRFSPVVSGLPKRVRIVDVSPRDGLQNEPNIVSTETKLELINRLAAAGLKNIEVASFVSPKWVPQMADNKGIMKGLTHHPGVSYSVLTPNMKGFQSALESGAKEIGLFTTPSEAFSRKNSNCSVDDSLKRMEEVAKAAIENGVKVRGYVSCVAGCPYEGNITPEQVLPIIEKLLAVGCYEISLGDTIGVGTPGHFDRLLRLVTKHVSPDILAIHCHDTNGQALANIFTSLMYGIKTVDSTVGGLGGCPYAAGASGNVATEDIVYMLHGLGIETGLDLRALVEAGRWICNLLKRPNGSKVGVAFKM